MPVVRPRRLAASLVSGLVTLLAVPAGLTAPATAVPSPAPPSGPSSSLEPAPPGTPQASVAALTGPKGYVESEFFLGGEADGYAPVGTWGIDGRWQAEVAESAVPYRTRLIVDRPADPRRFNGTVWVEWLNVSSGADLAPSFIQARDRILATGGAWVGVSAQRGGVEAARRSAPERYGSLDIPRDTLSYDVFAQAGEAVREQADVLLGGLRPRRVIAAGESQSAFRMTTYVNALHHADPVFDGFLIHSRFRAAAPLGEGFAGAVSTRIRDDVDVPVLQLQTESDLAGWEAVRQPNRGNVHTWEVAGSAHIDVYTIEAIAGRETDPAGAAWLMGCTRPVNDFPFRYAANAAYAALERWVRFGLRPPAARPLEIVGDVIQRDADGNAKGGLRLPDIDVPVASHSGLGNASTDGTGFFCGLLGTHTAFTPQRLAELYPTHRAYVRAYRLRTALAVARGHMTWADARAAVAAADAAPVPR